jgi:hypothetical protein
VTERRSLPDCLDQILDRIEPFSAQLAEFLDGGGSAELFVGWHVAGNSGATLDPGLMGRLKGCGLALALDIYADEPTHTGEGDD